MCCVMINEIRLKHPGRDHPPVLSSKCLLPTMTLDQKPARKNLMEFKRDLAGVIPLMSIIVANGILPFTLYRPH